MVFLVYIVNYQERNSPKPNASLKIEPQKNDPFTLVNELCQVFLFAPPKCFLYILKKINGAVLL